MTSARRGTLSRISVSSVSKLAIINGNVAFLAPEIGMVPFKRWPPMMRIRSMPPRLAAKNHACNYHYIAGLPLSQPEYGESRTRPCQPSLLGFAEGSDE